MPFGPTRLIRSLLAAALLVLALQPVGGADGADSEIATPFAFLSRDRLYGIPPGGEGYFSSLPRSGHQFLIVATRRLQRGERVSSSAMNYRVRSAAGEVFAPVGFGFTPTVLPLPFVMYGSWFTGEIGNESAEATRMALFFVVPEGARSFSIRQPDGAVADLRLVDAWQPSAAERLPELTVYAGSRIFLKHPFNRTRP